MKGFTISAGECTTVDTPVQGKFTLFVSTDGVLGIKHPDGTCVMTDRSVLSYTFAEFKALADAGSLTTGQDYLLNDHKTVCLIAGTTTKNYENNPNDIPNRIAVDLEPLIVRASSPSTIEEKAISTVHPNDELRYTLDSDWYGDLKVDGETMGAITYRRAPFLGHGLHTPYSDVAAPCDFRNIFNRSFQLDMTNINGNTATGNYVLWAESVTIGSYKEFSTVRPAYTATGSNDYIDSKIFNEETTNSNVKIEEKLWWNDGNPIPNIVFFGHVHDTVIKGANYLRMDCNFHHIHQVDEFANIIHTRNPDDSMTTYWWKTQMGDVQNCLFTFNVGLVKDSSRLTLTPDLANSTMLTTVHLRGMIKDTHNCHLPVKTTQQYGTYVRITNNTDITIPLHIASHYDRLVCENVLGSLVAKSSGGSYQDLSVFDVNASGAIKLRYGVNSNLEYTRSVLANIPRDKHIPLAGVVKLTGSGTQQIDNYARWTDGHQCEQIFEPANGLTISIPNNEVAGGFYNRATVTADGTNGERILVKPFRDGWIAITV